MSVSHIDEKLATGPFVGRLGSLLSVMVVAACVIIGVGWGVFGAPLSYGLVAWAVCTVSVLAAHALGGLVKQDHLFGLKLMAGLGVRALPPFCLAAWAIKFAQPPLESSFVFYILAFYLVGTFADVQQHIKSMSALSTKSNV